MTRWLIFIIIIATLLRVFSIVLTYHQPNDDWEYGEIAQNIVNGKGFSRIRAADDGEIYATSSHAPVYPLFLSVFYSFGRHALTFLLIKIIQTGLSVISIIFLYKLGRKLFDAKTGLLSSLILAVYPPYIYNAVKITPTVFFITFLILSTYLIFVKKQMFTNFLAGIIFAGTILCDPIGFLLIPVYLIWMIIAKREPRLNHLILFLTILTVLTPWTIRNYAVHKRIIPVTTQFGINFWIGNNPRATGTDYYRIDDGNERQYVFIPQTLPRGTRIALNNMTEIERSDFFLSQAIDHIANNPLTTIDLIARKTLYYWWFPPLRYSGSADSAAYRLYYILCYLPLLILGLAGIVMAFVNRNYMTAYLALLIIMISGIYILTHVGLARYRMPVEVLFMIPTGYCINNISNKLRKKSFPTSYFPLLT